ncbi:DUF885 domain-containing protein [Cryobacterium sp. LW097]|uniref:DUF885 domain-containing protein n=1 Tax=unclassified Cryobacterium TaxID=2649013 RepID=UPI000B4CCD9F|nr:MULTISPECIES: DUF885 domain-containing protein [unclassified Cryobacterium]ASD22198.1 DUF885 domain-containing protein [Cryobacterium sp. LW097]TFC55646.1 DUF885 domain-containing protein [Cryobacterium sp. TMB3-1-2]TFC72798.1 DUF885 domain-containing protein [Cryobacterium sp. TMB3-15]TFC76304.1 DUF885 domain-containing protein [Cryobacterium sp. TMB3-10]TFD43519.1 DUF885 domain-containing protein [Cryobacterium sp. TMB3-12]
MTLNEGRTPTPVDQIAEGWVDTLVSLDPTVGTYIGRSADGSGFADYSPDGHAAYVQAAAATIRLLDDSVPVDDVDRVTRTDLRSSLALDLESSAAGLQLRDLNVIASPAQGIREVFDLMPTATVEDWRNISARLGAVPAAITGYIETLRLGIEQGTTPARRQVREVLDQARRNAANDGFFNHFVADAGLEHGSLPASLATDLGAGAHAAATAYERLATFLADELEPRATEQDAVGRDLYALRSRHFLGATIDLDETYEWGIQELARMTEEQESVARQIKPGATVLEAIAFLDTDPARKLHGTDALQRWMQETSDRAVAELGATQFDIPEEIRRLECLIAPTQEGGIYYTGPTDDFSRPGRMWWSVPVGVTEFDTWRELTTVYHEGIPGHHLQIGQAVYNRASLNTWRRQLAGTSGHAEGWALYAERLMEQLGYLDDPADRLGMLDGQRMRAARVVLDIGVHLGKKVPDGSQTWTADYAFDFLAGNVNMNDGFVKFEVNRYLGWPGQAPSYKVGQRIWEQLRDDAKAREGTGFDIKEFHRRALDLGGVGLDTLRSALQN